MSHKAINSDRPSPESKPRPSGFTALDLSPLVLQAIADLGFTEPTDVQRQVIPLMLEGLDVVGQSQTGTGKTAAFGSPICSCIDPDEPSVQALILVPTRELCIQVATDLQKLGRHRGLKVAPIYGGQAIRGQIEQLEAGYQIVVGTPGRVIDHLQRRTLTLDHVTFVVLDECDEMLDIGFADDIDHILKWAPRQRQTSLFSATLPPFVLELIDRYLVRPQFVNIRPGQATVPEIDQVFCEVLEEDKLRAMRRLLKQQSLDGRMLIFRRTQRGVEWLVRRLRNEGHAVEGLHGGMSQDQRERVMGAFRAGRLPVLVATNVAARGLDIRLVSHVLNYDMPQDPEEYIHRIGRTGRAGDRGTAITFVGEWDIEMFDLIRKRVGHQMQPLDLGLYN
ncbi:MAG: DEAD/DEAH box helicase [Chloroflexi bacterium]|nr:DEAD/DEAH box helicase [Chloroflexota bacterium]